MSTCSVTGASGFRVLEDKHEEETICTVLKNISPLYISVIRKGTKGISLPF